jgi:spore germination protein KC
MRPLRQPARLLCVLLASSLLLAGCWDRQEINQLAIIGAVAIDGRPGDFQVSVEIFRPVPSGSSTGGGAGSTPGIRNVAIGQGRGTSILAAMRDLDRKVPRLIYGGHIVTCIVGEELARTDLREILDIWQRDMQLRMSAFLLIAEGTGYDILTRAQGEMESSIADQVEGLARTSSYTGYTTVSTVWDVITDILSPSKVGVTGIVRLAQGEQPPIPRSPGAETHANPTPPALVYTLELAGVAIIKETKLAAMIPVSPISRGVAASQGRIRGTVRDIACPELETDSHNGDTISLKVTHSDTKVEVEMKPALKARLRVNIEATLDSQEYETPISAEEMQVIQATAERDISREKAESVKALQGISCDAFGFAGVIYRKDPKLWASIKDNWDEVFSRLPVEVETRVRVRNVGMSKGPAWVNPAP